MFYVVSHLLNVYSRICVWNLFADDFTQESWFINNCITFESPNGSHSLIIVSKCEKVFHVKISAMLHCNADESRLFYFKWRSNNPLYKNLHNACPSHLQIRAFRTTSLIQPFITLWNIFLHSCLRSKSLKPSVSISKLAETHKQLLNRPLLNQSQIKLQ